MFVKKPLALFQSKLKLHTCMHADMHGLLTYVTTCSTIIPQRALNVLLINLKKSSKSRKELKPLEVDSIYSLGLYLRPGVYFPNVWLLVETSVYLNAAYLLMVILKCEYK